MKVKMSKKLPIAQDAEVLVDGAMPINPTISNETKIAIRPYKKMVRLPKRLIRGQERIVPTKASAYYVAVSVYNAIYV